MKKILFVINTMGRAGAEKSMTELMKVFDTEHFELHLLVLINRGEMYSEVPGFVKIHNNKPDSRTVLNAKLMLIRTVLKSMLKNFNILRNLPYLISCFLEQRRNGRIQPDKLFWRIISDGAPRIDEKFDAAFAYLEGGAAYYVADHVNADKKAAFIHIDYRSAGYTPRQDHNCYSAMDRIYIVSEQAKKSFLEIYPGFGNKVQLFYNIINSDSIKRLADEGKGFEDDFSGIRILTIGRLHYQKAYDISIPVLAQLKKEGYKLRWYVLGDGAIRPELERLIEKYRLTDDFILLGAVSNPYPYLRQCDLYVHCTRFEGKSIAIEEAQVLGKAIIASDCSGNREQITDGVNGLIVSLEEEEIANGIKRLLKDKALIQKFEQETRKIEFDYRKNIELLYRFMGGTYEGYFNYHSCI